MNEEKYKLKILKDILKFSKSTINEEDLKELMASPIFLNKNYFTSGALLVKREAITMSEFLNLKNLTREELKEYPDPVDDDFDYFAIIKPEEVLQAFKDMEEFIKNNPKKTTREPKRKSKEISENKRILFKWIRKIKEVDNISFCFVKFT